MAEQKRRCRQVKENLAEKTKEQIKEARDDADD